MTHRFQSSGIKRVFSEISKIDNKLVIGTVFCRRGSLKVNKYYDQTNVMLNSVLISAKLFNITIVEIHLFLEYPKDEKHFWEDIQKIRFPDKFQNLEVILQAHLAVNTEPKQYRDQIIYHRRYRCGYVRFFYPVFLQVKNTIL